MATSPSNVVPFSPGQKKAKRVEPYPIDPRFEKAIVYWECKSPRFHALVGHALDPEAFPTPEAKLAIEACLAIARDLGNGPGSEVTVVQRVRRWLDEGKRTRDAVISFNEYLISAEDDVARPPLEVVVKEFAPLVQRRLERDGLTRLMELHGARQDVAEAANMLLAASRIGVVDESLGTKFGEGTRAAIERIRHLARLPTGIKDLDSTIDGGLGRGCSAFFIGNTGDGKSLGLTTVTGTAQRLGLFVGVVTLELPESIQAARLYANHTGIPTNEILADKLDEAQAMLARMNLGPCVFKDGGVDTVAALDDWVKRCEDHEGRKMDLVVIDYADRMKAARENKFQRENEVMKEVYEGLYEWNKRRDAWLWSASAGKVLGKKAKSEVKDVEDAAGSADKGRAFDLAITLNVRDDGASMLYKVGKNRIGPSRHTVGPLATDFARGSIAPIDREVLPF